MSKRYGARPSELAGTDDPYAAYCLDEACVYMLCRIEKDGRLPRALESQVEPVGNARTVETLARRGCRVADLRSAYAKSSKGSEQE